MKNKKEILTYIFVGIISSLLTGSVTAYATSYLYNSDDVSYDNTTSGISATNVQDAIDQLYTSSNNYSSINTRVTEIETRLGKVSPDSYVDIGSYTSANNAYTTPCDGYLFVYNASSSQAGYIMFAGGSGGPAIGDAGTSRNTVYVRKGTKVYVSGSVSAARFYKLN